MENRRFNRIDLETFCYWRANDAVVTGRILNISRSGVLVEVAEAPLSWLPDVGASSIVAFDLPRNGTVGARSFVCAGRVVRTDFGAGAAPRFAIDFIRMSIKARPAAQCLTGARGLKGPTRASWFNRGPQTAREIERTKAFQSFWDAAETSTGRPS